MKCCRCGSRMVFEKFYGPNEYFPGWRCIQCGEIVDQVILENRQQKTTANNREMRQEIST